MMKRMSTLCVLSSALAAFAFCANSARAATLTVRTTTPTVKVPTPTPTVHTPPTGSGGLKPGIVKQTFSSGSVKQSKSKDPYELTRWGVTYQKIEVQSKGGKSTGLDDWNAH